MAYTRVNWQDLPSTSTPRNAANLNIMDAGIKENDDKLSGAKSIQNTIYANDFKCRNLFDDSTNNNLWVTQDGSVSTQTGSNCRKFFVKPGEKYTLSATYSSSSSGSNIIVMAIYDSNNTLLSRTATNNPLTITKVIPDNASYMYVGHYVGKPTTIQLEIGSEATPYTPYKPIGEDVYSTEERRIGTWVDGKPLYSKTYKVTSPSSENSTSWVQNISSIPYDFIRIAKGSYLTANTNITSDVNHFISVSNFSSCWIGYTDKAIEMLVAGSARLSKTVYITIEYTKTTD